MGDMGTWLILLISLGCLLNFSYSNSFSSPSLLSLPVPFNPSSSSPVVVIPIIEEPQLNQIPSENPPLQPPSPCPSPGYHRDPLSCGHFYICSDLWAAGTLFQVIQGVTFSGYAICQPMKTGASASLRSWDCLGRG